jgi:hypothetical protein
LAGISSLTFENGVSDVLWSEWHLTSHEKHGSVWATPRFIIFVEVEMKVEKKNGNPI